MESGDYGFANFHKARIRGDIPMRRDIAAQLDRIQAHDARTGRRRRAIRRVFRSRNQTPRSIPCPQRSKLDERRTPPDIVQTARVSHFVDACLARDSSGGEG